jgi:hypothetical protein
MLALVGEYEAESLEGILIWLISWPSTQQSIFKLV